MSGWIKLVCDVALVDAEFWLCGLGFISRGIFAEHWFWSYLDDRRSAFDLLAAAAAVGILLVWINWFLLNPTPPFWPFQAT